MNRTVPAGGPARPVGDGGVPEPEGGHGGPRGLRLGRHRRVRTADRRKGTGRTRAFGCAQVCALFPSDPRVCAPAP
jgi:hypothetical protein